MDIRDRVPFKCPSVRAGAFGDRVGRQFLGWEVRGGELSVTRIVFDATAVGSGLGGDETFLSGVLEGLAAHTDLAFECQLLVRSNAELPASVASDDRFSCRAISRQRGFLHYSAGLPLALVRERSADLVHTITHAPIVSTLPLALTIGDLSFRHRPQDYPQSTRIRLNTLVPRHARRARMVIAPSEFSRGDLIDSYGLDSERVFVVPNGLPAPVALDPHATQRAASWCAERGVHHPFVLYLGNVHPRKNVERLIEAFQNARRSSDLEADQIVIAGASWFDQRGPIPDPAVVRLGRVDNEVRRWLLAEARALGYVSLFEGFGIPPVEAMAVGTPVLASTVTAIPEVCGDAAVLVDPTDVDAIAAGLIEVCRSGPARDALIDRGLRRAAHFDTRTTGLAAAAAFNFGIGQPLTKSMLRANKP
jgi:glycosyltransferase involved in cell wall biosynthesis